MTGAWSADDRGRLLTLARQSLSAAVTRTPSPVAAGEVYDRRAGVFVTLHCHGRLRGCIGQIEPDRLGAAIAHCAASAALDDPRFPAVTCDEIATIHIELSILGPLSPLADPAHLELGRHGLAVNFRGRRGLLLPQVPVEWGWTRQTFLEQTCRKAGLPADAWQNGAQLFVFETEIFGEPEP